MSEPDPEYANLLERAYAADRAGQPTSALYEQLFARYLELARGGTTPGGLPYPTPTDPFAEGADAIRALAEALNPHVEPVPWMDLTPFLADGVSYSADGDPLLAGIGAQRAGRLVELNLGNFIVASMSIPADGNVPNINILEGIPERFRPSKGVVVTGGWAGRGWWGYVHPDGSVKFAAVVPNATQTGTVTMTNQTYAGSVTYLAAAASADEEPTP